jgi:hypothetical protein
MFGLSCPRCRNFEAAEILRREEYQPLLSTSNLASQHRSLSVRYVAQNLSGIMSALEEISLSCKIRANRTERSWR